MKEKVLKMSSPAKSTRKSKRNKPSAGAEAEAGADGGAAGVIVTCLELETKVLILQSLVSVTWHCPPKSKQAWANNAMGHRYGQTDMDNRKHVIAVATKVSVWLSVHSLNIPCLLPILHTNCPIDWCCCPSGEALGGEVLARGLKALTILLGNCFLGLSEVGSGTGSGSGSGTGSGSGSGEDAPDEDAPGEDAPLQNGGLGSGNGNGCRPRWQGQGRGRRRTFRLGGRGGRGTEAERRAWGITWGRGSSTWRGSWRGS